MDAIAWVADERRHLRSGLLLRCLDRGLVAAMNLGNGIGVGRVEPIYGACDIDTSVLDDGCLSQVSTWSTILSV